MVKIIFTYKNTLLTKSNDKRRNYRLYFLGLIGKENISKLAVLGPSATNFVCSLRSKLILYVHNFCNF